MNLKNLFPKRVSLAVLAGFAPVTAFCTIPLFASNQTWEQRYFYMFKNLAKSFTTVNLEEPEDWKYPHHPHVEYIYPFYVDARSKSTSAERWGSVKVHTLMGTYVPIGIGLLLHHLAERTGLNKRLRDAGTLVDI